jgi:hypothetical protein
MKDDDVRRGLPRGMGELALRHKPGGSLNRLLMYLCRKYGFLAGVRRKLIKSLNVREFV